MKVTHQRASQWAALLTLSFVLPEAMAQKGKPSGGGPSTVPAPVEYQVAWLEWPETNTNLNVEDVNSDGYVAGWCRPSAREKNIGIVMHPSGVRWDLNVVFAASLQSEFAGWRYNDAFGINESGMVAGVLVGDDYWGRTPAPDHIVVVGNIHDPGAGLVVVDQFSEGGPRGALTNSFDFNEHGDTLLSAGGAILVYAYPSGGGLPSAPWTVYGPPGTSSPYWVSLNDTLTVAGVASGPAIKKGRWTDYEPRGFVEKSTGVVADLGVTHHGFHSIAADAAVYTVQGSAGLPSRWSPLTGTWAPVAGSGQPRALSKAPAGAEELLINNATVDGRTVVLVYKRGLGAFVMEVTSGQTQADLDAFFASGAGQPFAISNPTTATGHGRLAGEGTGGIYLLTPVVK
jgi:hypothetical protein